MFQRVERASAPTPAACRAAVDAAARDSTAVMLCIADQPGLDLEAIAAALSDASCAVIGGVFPALVSGGARFTTGALAFGFSAASRRAILQNTFEPSAVLTSILRSALDGPPTPKPPTLLMLVDGQAPGSATCLLDAVRLPYLHLGATAIGGGAGYATASVRPCLFTEHGMLPRGGGVVLQIDAPNSVAAEHGWIRMSGPHYANRSSQTTIDELDWRSASEVYVEAIGAPRGAFSPKWAAQHPIAVLGVRETTALRDPVAFTGTGGVYTLGHIPEHALVAIMRAEPLSLIGAAGAAARAANGASESRVRRGLVFDCVSRHDALAERFDEELQRIQREFDQPIAGALTLGEIASNGARGVEFHNKTVVVAAG